MTVLVAALFPYDTTASAAAEDVRQIEGDLAPDTVDVAVVSCDERGEYRVTTSHRGDPGDSRGLFWLMLFKALIFVPAAGRVSGRRTLTRRLADAGIDRRFQRAVHDGLGPDTSALFLVVDEPPDEDAVDVLRRFAGTVLTATLSPRAEALIAEAVRDSSAVAPAFPVLPFSQRTAEPPLRRDDSDDLRGPPIQQ